MKIVLASRNKKNIEELRQLLSELRSNVEVLSLDDVGITGDIEEDGTVFISALNLEDAKRALKIVEKYR